MRTKCLVFIVVVLISLGLSGLASAQVNDVPGDALVSGYDIVSADCVVYPPMTMPATYMKAGIEMDDKLPGLVVFEFDVDDDSATGRPPVSILGISPPCATGPPVLKTQTGIDIEVMIFLRKQGDDVETAWCDDCVGAGGICATRDTVCNNCNESDCYTLSGFCNPGDPACYLMGDACTNCIESDCFVLADLCTPTEPCGKGRVTGEWYAIAGGLGSGSAPVASGRIDTPLPTATDAGSEDCYHLPWAIIVQAAYDALDGNPLQFDLTKASDSSNLKYQASTWYDVDYTTTENDFFDPVNLCAEVTDVVPNTGLASARQGHDDCLMNPNQDPNVDAIDISSFLTEFGRSWFYHRCPSCTPGNSDPSSDELVSGYDIVSADAVVYPSSSMPATYMKAGITMDDKLPGLVVFEFDVDDDTTTGGSLSMTGMLNPCSTGSPKLKVEEGFDIALLLMLRSQADDAATAWCAGCAGDLCNTGRERGEWYAIASALGIGSVPVARGRFDTPLPAPTDNPWNSKDCYQFPWSRIVQAAYDALAGNAKQFDLVKATDYSNLKYQASTWYDVDYTTTENDFLNIANLCAEVTDVSPDTGKCSARHGYNECLHDVNGDGGVDSLEVGVFLSEFGRSTYNRPCPVCQ